MHKPASVLENKTHKLLLDFKIQMLHLISAWRPDLIINNKKKRGLADGRLCCPDLPQSKINENEKKRLLPRLFEGIKKKSVKYESDDYSAFGTVSKGLMQGLEDLEIIGRVETIQLLHYWDQPEFLKESWRFEENCFHSNFSERQSANADEKNFQGVKK